MTKRKYMLFSILLVMILSAAGCRQTQTTESAQTEETSLTAEPVQTEESSHTSEPAQSAEDSQEAGAGSSRELPDGSYVPASFQVQGGTGKVKITCPEVVLKQGRAEALLEFSSPHYEWVRAGGVQYEPENAGEDDRKTSDFRIPVLLDEEMTISALTTAMSEPHEIEYTLLISLSESEAAGGSGTEETAEEFEESLPFEPGEDSASEPPVLPGFTFAEAMETYYAEAFDVYYYRREDGTPGEYCLIDIHGSGQYLLTPGEDSGDPAWAAKLPDSITVLGVLPDNIYVAATSSMALFDAAGALDRVKLTGTRADGWYIEAPKRALENGSMVYAGKYSAPDYELLTSSGCDLAVESIMILHAPEVKEKLEELGIPVLIDTSSTERHPLGRTEWVRLYGALTGHTEEADAFFEEQRAQFDEAEKYADTGLTAAFFSVSSNGNVIVRASDDYIANMIELAGGHYVFTDLLKGSGHGASVRLSAEEFYAAAKDADFLIYNATIESPAGSIRELCGRMPLLSDFKAVQSGDVWQVRRSLYQSPDTAVQMITDIHKMLTGSGTDEMVFLEQLPSR